MSLVASPIFYRLWTLNQNQDDYSTYSYSPKLLLNVDVFSMGSMYNAVSLPNAASSDTDLIGSWRTIFLLVEFVNIIVLLVCMGVWFRRSDEIEQIVNDDQLKPSD